MSNLSSYVTKSTYSPTGKPQQYELSSGGKKTWLTYAYEYGTQRLAESRTDRQDIAGVDRDAIYGYDNAGNVTSITDTSRSGTDTQCFGYDYQRRLTEAWTPSGGCGTAPDKSLLGGPAPYWSSYRYDTTGNRTGETQHGVGSVAADTTRTYDYPAPGQGQHQLRSISQTGAAGNRTDTFGYDASGNTTSRTIGGVNQTLAWDHEGHLATTTDSTGTTGYAYDADGKRLLRRDPTSTTLYLPDMELRLDKTTGQVSGTRYYTHNGAVVAMRTSTGVRLLASDPHGSADLSIDAATQAVAQRRFTPFGQFRGSPTGVWPNDKGFVGGTIDPSGLTHLGAREYDPGTGRFLSTDPVFDSGDPQSWNGYAYADNNPTTHSDPSGLHIPTCQTQGECDDSGVHRGRGNPWRGGGRGSSPVRHSCNWWCHTKNVGNAVADEVADTVVAPIRAYMGMPRNIAGGTAALACAEGAEAACGIAAHNPYTPPPDTHIPLGGDTASPEYKVTRLVVRYAPVVLGGAGAARVGLRAGLRAGLRSSARAAEEAAARPSVTGCNSFVPGTAVLLANGKQKPIEKVKVGDKVLATDPVTGETRAEPVIVTFGGTRYKNLIKITVDTDGAHGRKTAIIIATEHHKFWDPVVRRWVQADHLTHRSTLRTTANKPAHVLSATRFPGHPAVHDLTIAGIHTYYVEAGTVPVLVHNCGVAPEDHNLPSPQDAQDIIQNAPRGSSAAVKSDPYHRAPIFMQNEIAGRGTVWRQPQRDPMNPDTPMHVSVPGEVNGRVGIFHWIVDRTGTLVHEAFEPGRG